MEENLKHAQVQIMEDFAYSESIISAVNELAPYLKPGKNFFEELELTNSTLQELLQRTSKTLEPEHLKAFVLASKQVRMMANDLLFICKKKMYSA